MLIYLVLSNSQGCNEFVIDTHEIYSGINIPEVSAMKCFCDNDNEVRISVYGVKGSLNLIRFEMTGLQEAFKVLSASGHLQNEELPSSKQVYYAHGEKWGGTWTNEYDPQSRMLWTEIRY